MTHLVASRAIGLGADRFNSACMTRSVASRVGRAEVNAAWHRRPPSPRRTDRLTSSVADERLTRRAPMSTMQNRTFGPYLAAIHRILDSVMYALMAFGHHVRHAVVCVLAPNSLFYSTRRKGHLDPIWQPLNPGSPSQQ
jgi:hypothetical protein